MKLKKLITATILTVLLASMTVLPVMAKTNIALNAKVDSVCPGGDAIEAELPDYLVDDDEGYATKWCAINGSEHEGEPHWLILDFESDKTFDGVRLVKASEGERDYGQPQYDAFAFHFDVSSDKTNWTTVLTVTGDGEVPIYEGNFPDGAVTARYLRLVVDHPEQAEDSNETAAVRLYDLKVWEAATPAAEVVAEAVVADTPAATVENTPVIVATTATTAPKTADPMIFIVLISVISAGAVVITRRSIKTK